MPEQAVKWSDPRSWSREKRAAHLDQIGLPLLEIDSAPDGSLVYGAGHRATEFSYYRQVYIEWTSTLDDRITKVIDAMTDYERSHLYMAYAHKGGCGFLWIQEIPDRWKDIDGITVPPFLAEDEDGEDWWTIDISDVLFVDQPGIPDAKDEYADYLKSDHWQHMREVAKEHYGERCVLCGETNRLDVHHRTYERKGRELLSDLIVLCRDCHGTYHARS